MEEIVFLLIFGIFKLLKKGNFHRSTNFKANSATLLLSPLCLKSAALSTCLKKQFWTKLGNAVAEFSYTWSRHRWCRLLQKHNFLVNSATQLLSFTVYLLPRKNSRFKFFFLILWFVCCRDSIRIESRGGFECYGRGVLEGLEIRLQFKIQNLKFKNRPRSCRR